MAEKDVNITRCKGHVHAEPDVLDVTVGKDKVVWKTEDDAGFDIDFPKGSPFGEGGHFSTQKDRPGRSGTAQGERDKYYRYTIRPKKSSRVVHDPVIHTNP